MSNKKKKIPGDSPKPVLEQSAVLNEFVERDASVEPQSEINYDTLIHLQSKKRELEPEEEEQSKKVVFYCRDCQKICEAKKKGSKGLQFECPECSGSEIYFGSELGIRGFFHVK